MELQKLNTHQVQVFLYKNGQRVAKNLPINDVELESDGKVVKLGDLLSFFDESITEARNKITELNNKVNDFIALTNSNISAILSAIEVQEESEEIY